MQPNIKKIIYFLAIPSLFFILTLIYLFPLLQGLILLPVDLLVSNYNPWYQPGTILLKNPYMQDSVVQLFPWRHLVFESLTKGIIPLWNPYQYLGAPFMANLKPLVFYPLNILFVLGEARSWNALLFSQIFLSMLFAYYLMRDFKLNIFSSILAAMAFGLNSFMIGLLQFGSDAHTMLWWPIIILCAKRYLDNKKRRYLFFLSLTFAFSILGGQLQYTGYFLIFLVSFILFYSRYLKSNIKSLVRLFLSIFLGASLTALQLIPSIELFSQSHRGLLSASQHHQIFSSGLISFDKLFRLFAPDFFGNPVTRDLQTGYIETSGYFGIIPLFFACFAMIFGLKNRLIKFFTIVFLVSVIFSFKFIGELLYIVHLPLITNGSGGRIFTIVLFSGAILSGFGFSEFMTYKNRRVQILSLVSFGGLFSAIILGAYAGHIFTSLEALIRSIKFAALILILFLGSVSIYLFLLKTKIKHNYLKISLVVVILGLTFFDFFRFGYRFLTFSNEKFLYPELGVTQFVRNISAKDLGRTFGLTEPELGTALNIYTVETYNPLYLLRTSSLLQSLQKIPPTELSVDNKYFLTTAGKDLEHTFNFLGVKYIVSSKDENPSQKYFMSNKFESILTRIYVDDRFAVFENKNAYPRFGLYYDYEVIKEDDEILKAISDNKSELDLQKTIILKENLPMKFEQGTGSAKLLSSTVNSLEFQITTNKPALFYISDTFYPGWNATINDEPAKIYQANYNFRAVLIPKEGTSTIKFTYLPKSFSTGIVISVLSLLCLLGLILTGKEKSSK